MTQPRPRKPGRPPKPPGSTATARISERVTPEEFALYQQLGGKSWLLQQIARARTALQRNFA